MGQSQFHHTLRTDLIKDILIWSGSFFLALSIAFVLTLDSLVNYMVADMAGHRMHYQLAEFSKHLSQGDTTSITEESEALVQDESISGILLVDASGLLVQVSLKDGEPPRVSLTRNMSVEEMRSEVALEDDLVLFEERIPGHTGSLVLILDKGPILKAIYTSTGWTAALLIFFIILSIVVLHFSLRKHLIKPVDEVRHLMDDDLKREEKEELISHLPDEVAALAISYEASNEAHLLMERQFNQAQKMEAIGTLVGGIAHDFNNTLAGIVGNLYLAKQGATTLPDVVEKLDRIEVLSLRSSETVKNLLAFAHKTHLETAPVGLGSFIKEAIKLNRVSVPESVNLTYHVSDEDLTVNGDVTQLHQVLLNLINNAFHATEGMAEQNISVSVERFNADEQFLQKHAVASGHFARIAVSDNGRGIAADVIEHIFEPFFTTKEVGKGTGLGLAMVYGSIKSQHGIIEVESEPGCGATFNVFLPLIENEEGVDFASSDDPVQGQGESILLADDEEGLLVATCEVLESLGYRVFSAADGQQAVSLYREKREEIDLVILDVVMPRLGGIMAAQQIREIDPAARVVFVTGYDEKSFSGGGEELHHPVIHKPYAIEELSLLIRQQLDPA